MSRALLKVSYDNLLVVKFCYCYDLFFSFSFFFVCFVFVVSLNTLS